MTILVQDVPAPAKATAASLKTTFDRCGGDNHREKGRRFLALLEAAVKDRQIDLSQVLLEEVGHRSMGERWKAHLIEGRNHGGHVDLVESGQPVTSDFFSAVTGQVIYSEIRRTSELPEFIFSKLVRTMQSGLPGTETVPEITAMGDVAETVLEGQEYPKVGIGAATTTLPASVKKGLGLDLTEEAMSFTAPQGLTQFILAQAGAVGNFLGLRKELSLIDVIIGFVNNYIRNGTGTNTYLTAGSYVNNQTGVDLVDYTDVDAAEQLLGEMVDPTTGLPIPIADQSRVLIVSPARVMRASSIINATTISVGDITTGTGLQTTSRSPIAMPVQLVSSRLMMQRIIATMEAETAKAHDGWFWGSLMAFVWKELWPLAVFQQSGQGSAAGFERDVVMRWKARYHGVAAVKEPRLITRNENSAWAL
jgi:hypothetical protein